MSWWKNPTDSEQGVVLFGDVDEPDVTVRLAPGAVGFVPDKFDRAIRGSGGSGLAPAWVKAEEPKPEAEEPKVEEKKKGR